MRATIGRTVKELAVIYLLVTAAAVPLIVAMAGAILWIETGSPWAGPVVIGTLVLMVAAGVWVARPWRR